MYTRSEVLDRHPSEMAKLSQVAYNKMAREHSLAGTCRYCGAELTKFFMFRYKKGMYYCNYECRSYELAAKGLRNMRLEAEEIARETKAATKAAGALKAGACSECGTAIRVGEYEGPNTVVQNVAMQTAEAAAF